MLIELNTVAKAIAGRKRVQRRLIVAIAGAPGSGKSTFAAALRDLLNQNDPSCATVMPMDGFHLDNSVLSQRGQLDQKGAPETFDIDGFCAALARIRTGDRDVIIPVFDRNCDTSRAGARVVDAATGIIIVEGNYLLVDRPEWTQAAQHYDLTVFLDVPMATLEERLVQRWLDHGLDAAVAVARARGNDQTNATIVINASRPADLRVAIPVPVASVERNTSDAD